MDTQATDVNTTPPGRGTGRTTQEIKSSPINTFYVCLHERHCRYVKELARTLERTDLWICTPGYILEGLYHGSTWRIVIDHAVLEQHPRAEELIIHAMNQTRHLNRSAHESRSV